MNTLWPEDIRPARNLIPAPVPVTGKLVNLVGFLIKVNVGPLTAVLTLIIVPEIPWVSAARTLRQHALAEREPADDFAAISNQIHCHFGPFLGLPPHQLPYAAVRDRTGGRERDVALNLLDDNMLLYIKSRTSRGNNLPGARAFDPIHVDVVL